MFTRLERYVFPALVALALWAAVLVAVPAAAQAQAAVKKDEDARGADRGAGANLAREVVRPGDSLWTISSEELRPNATPQQITAGAERIYALNREQIGPDPNLIVPGQRLLVPSSGSEPSASGRSAGTEPLARKADEAASDEAVSGGNRAGRQTKHETLGAPRQAAAEVRGEAGVAPEAASKPADRPDAAEELPRSPDEFFVGEARAAVAGAASALVGLFPSDEGYEGYNWRELLGAALLAVSSVAAVLTLLLAFALVAGPERARRSQQEDWWREVQANGRAYELASFAPSHDKGLENGRSGAHARTNGAHANGNVPVEVILAVERKRGRLRRHGRPRRGRPRSPARHVRRGLAHDAYSPNIRHLLRGASGDGSRRPASRASASSERLTAAPRRTGVRGR